MWPKMSVSSAVCPSPAKFVCIMRVHKDITLERSWLHSEHHHVSSSLRAQVILEERHLLGLLQGADDLHGVVDALYLHVVAEGRVLVVGQRRRRQRRRQGGLHSIVQTTRLNTLKHLIAHELLRWDGVLTYLGRTTASRASERVAAVTEAARLQKHNIKCMAMMQPAQGALQKQQGKGHLSHTWMGTMMRIGIIRTSVLKSRFIENCVNLQRRQHFVKAVPGICVLHLCCAHCSAESSADALETASTTETPQPQKIQMPGEQSQCTWCWGPLAGGGRASPAGRTGT